MKVRKPRVQKGIKMKSYDNTSRALKKAGITTPIGRRKGDWELRKEQHIPGKPKPPKRKRHPLALPEAANLDMAKDRAGGMSEKEIAKKYAVSVRYVHDALHSLFIHNKVGREILRGVLLDNAISTGMRVRETVQKLTPMQSVIATGVMTQRFIDIDKHTQAQQLGDIDFTELLQIGQELKQLNREAGVEIDVEVEVDRDEEIEE